MATEEWRGIRNTLLYLLFAFYGLVFLQLILDGGRFIKVASFIFWIGSVILLFKIPSMARLAGLGEVLELARLTPQVPDAEKNQVPAVMENQVSVMVERLSEKLLFLFTTCCLIIPIYPIRNNPWIIAVFTMTATIVFLFIWRRKSDWVRPIGLIVSLVFLAINTFNSFPQLSYYTGLEKLTSSVVSAATAEVANETVELRRKQRDEMVRNVHIKIRNWQKEEKNKGKEPPENLQKELEAAKLGLTVSEYDKKLEADAKAKAEKEEAEADAKAKAEAEAKVKASGVNAPVANAVPSEKRKIFYKKPDNHEGTNKDIRSGHLEIKSLVIDGDEINIKVKHDVTGIESNLIGIRKEGNKFMGNYQNQDSERRKGKWEFDFSPDFQIATGWQTNENESVKVPTWIK